MTKLLRTNPSTTRVVLALLLTSLTLLLTACPEDPALVKPEITLSVSDTNLPDGGGEVILTAEVTKGTVNDVTFKRDKGAAIPVVTTPNAQGDFVTTVTVTETTTFTATATGPGGTAPSTPTGGVKVTVAPINPINDPKAPSATSALEGFEDLDLVVGTPTGLAVVATTIPGVTGGIVGEVKPETKATSKGNVTILAGTDRLEFSYTPNDGATGTDSFEYTVVKASREAKGRIDITLADISSADVQLADSLADINDTSSQHILLTSDVRCTTNPCITLENNQALIGLGTITVDDITITNANSTKPKIIANIPGTRPSGTPSGSGAESRVIILADDVTIEGIEITSDSGNETSAYFTAMYGRSDRTSGSENVLDGDIIIRNVTISRSNGKPIYLQYTFPYNPSATFGTYHLFIENLDLNDANDTLVIGNPTELDFKDSTVELLQPSGTGAGPNAFGDNAGVLVASYVNSDVTIDNVDVSMENTFYQIDNGPENNNAVPFEVSSDRSDITTTLVVKNSDVTFGDIPSGSDSAAFRVKGNGGTVNIDEDASVNNTSKEGSSDAPGINRIGNVNGTIQFN
jgi:hypothetical protein